MCDSMANAAHIFLGYMLMRLSYARNEQTKF